MRDRLGKYTLQKTLGKGAFGEVYLALDTFAGSEVALKVIDSSTFRDPDARAIAKKQFLNEASLAGKLAHPHIVTILEAVVDDDPGYVAMEYVPGGTLADRLRAGAPLALEDTIEIAFKCCGALDYASRHGIVHRDIKPANIMVVQGTEVKVSDFGAAYFRHAQDTQIADIGTPLYESPEQIGGRALTQQSDMFSLGIVLYEMLTGRRAFDASSLPELFKKILNGETIAPSRINASLPAGIDEIVLRALSKNPEDRYPTWADFALDLADVGKFSVFAKTIPDSERFRSLRRMPILKEFGDVEIWELARAGKWSRHPARSVILREGEDGQSMFFLGEGQVKVMKGGRLLNLLGNGECFGEMAYVQSGPAPREATIEAATDVQIVEFERGALNGFSHGCQLRFAQVLLHTLVDRLALADERILQLADRG